MKENRAHNSVILLVDGKRQAEYQSVKTWLAEHSFMTYEADDIFDAVDEFWDFTVRDIPDVILVQVDGHDGDCQLTRMIIESTQPDMDLPIVFYSRNSADTDCISSLTQLDENLAGWIPQPHIAARQIASV